MRTGKKALVWSAAALLGVALVAAGCGKKSTKATDLNVTVSESGSTAKYTAPTTVKGGLVRLVLTNHGKAPHAGQLVLIEGNHSAQAAVKIISGNSRKTPEWIRAEGGVGGAAPGQPAQATVNLPEGKYLVGDFTGQSKTPGYAQLTVTSGKNGKLPSTPTTVTAANPSKDKYKWEISGGLKPGANNITFDSKGKEAIHFIGAFHITGNHSIKELINVLKSNGKPPSYVDQSSFATSSVLDGGKSQVTAFDFRKPGKYVLFCPLSDRNGGKPHFLQGLITTVDVK